MNTRLRFRRFGSFVIAILAALVMMAGCSSTETLTSNPEPELEAGAVGRDSDDPAATIEEPTVEEPTVEEPVTETATGEQTEPVENAESTTETPAGVQLASVRGSLEDVTFALLPRGDIEPATCLAIEAWYDAFAAAAVPEIEAMQAGTDLGPLLAATEAIEETTDGEAALYFRQWMVNLAERQELLDSAAASGEPADELKAAFRAIEEKLAIYDTYGITSRIWERCVLREPSRLEAGRNHFSSVQFEAPNTIVFVEGLSLTVGHIELTEFRTAAIWVDPWFGLQYDDQYRATQNPWLYVDFTMTNTGDATFDFWEDRPFPVYAPSGAVFNSLVIQSPDRESGFQSLEPGESRATAFAIELESGYLLPDATRQVPGGLEDWALGFQVGDSVVFVTVDGNEPVTQEAEATPTPSAPEPTAAPSAPEEAATPDAADPDASATDSDLTAAEQQEVAQLVEIFLQLLDPDSEQEACLRTFVNDNAVALVRSDDFGDAVLLELVLECQLQARAMLTALEFRFSNETAACIIDSMERDMIDAIWLETIQLSDQEAGARLDEVAAQFPECG